MLTPLQFQNRAATRFADNEYQNISEKSFRDFADDIRTTFVSQAAVNVPDYEPGRYYAAGFVIRYSFSGSTPVFLAAGSPGFLLEPTDPTSDPDWLPCLSPAGPGLSQVGTVAALRQEQGNWAPGRLYVLTHRADPATGDALPDVFVRALSVEKLEPEGYTLDLSTIPGEPRPVRYDLATDETAPLTATGYTDAEIDAFLGGKQPALRKAVHQSLYGNYQMPKAMYGQLVTFHPTGAALITLPLATLADIPQTLAVTRGGGAGTGYDLTFTAEGMDAFILPEGQTVFLALVRVERGTPYNDAIASWVPLNPPGAAGASLAVQQQHTQQLNTLGVQAAPVMVYSSANQAVGYPTADAAFADASHGSPIFMRFNTGQLAVTTSNASKNTPWPTYLDASGSAVFFADGVTLTIPGLSSLSLVVTNFFFFFQNNAPTGTAQVVLAGQANGPATPARAPQFLNGYSEVPFQLKGATYTFTNGYYASFTGTGTVHLYGNVQVDSIDPGIIVVDHRGSATADTYATLAYAPSLVLDFATATTQLLHLAGNLAVTATAGRAQGRQLRLHLYNATGADVSLSWPNWAWRGNSPASLAAGKQATLSLECAWGGTETDLIAGYAAQP